MLIEKSETPRLLRVDVGHPEFSHGRWAFLGLDGADKVFALISRTGHQKGSVSIRQFFMIPLSKYTQISQMRLFASYVVRWRSCLLEMLSYLHLQRHFSTGIIRINSVRVAGRLQR